MKNGHPGIQGPTIINKIEKQMDKRRKVMENIVVEKGLGVSGDPEYLLNQGRYEGLAAAIALLRSSNVPDEIARSNERLGIS